MPETFTGIRVILFGRCVSWKGEASSEEECSYGVEASILLSGGDVNNGNRWTAS